MRKTQWVVEELPQQVFQNKEQCLDAYEKWLEKNLTKENKTQYCDWLLENEEIFETARVRLDRVKDLVPGTQPKKGPPDQPKKQLSAEETARAERRAAAKKEAEEMKPGTKGKDKSGDYYGGDANELHVHVVGGEAILKKGKGRSKTFINNSQVNKDKLAEAREEIMNHAKADALLIAINRALIKFKCDELVEQRQDIDKNGKPKP